MIYFNYNLDNKLFLQTIEVFQMMERYLNNDIVSRGEYDSFDYITRLNRYLFTNLHNLNIAEKIKYNIISHNSNYYITFASKEIKQIKINYFNPFSPINHKIQVTKNEK